MKRSNLSLMLGRSARDVLMGFVPVVLCTVALAVFLIPAFANAATWYVAPESMGGDDGNTGSEASPWRTISHAVSQASAGDTIKVMDDDTLATDDYVENITINKSLTIERYDDTGANPQVAASDANSHVFHVTADSVTIKGLDIYGATEPEKAGIYLDNSAVYCAIQNNHCGWDSIHCNYAGIKLYSSSNNTISGNVCNSNNEVGISLWSSSNNNTVSGNTCSNNNVGIFLAVSSNNNTVSDNICNSNNLDGISLFVSNNNNTVSGNTCSNNDYGITLESSSNNNTVSGNTCSNNNVGIFLGDASNNNTVSDNGCSSNDYAGINLQSSSNNTVSGNTCSNNSRGIVLISSSNDNTISGNTCSNNDYGITLESSTDNTVSGNICSSNNQEGIRLRSASANTVSGNTCNLNNDYGIYVRDSNENTIYMNNFSDNTTTNVYSEGSTNTWRSPTKLGYLYGGPTQTYKRYTGNYYSDYGGNDGDSDGIGDSPYDLPGSEPDDDYPLVQAIDNYDLQVWVLANPIMVRGDMSKPGATVAIDGDSSVTWVAEQPAETDIPFGAGDRYEETSWTGQVTFSSVPAMGDTFLVEVGYADDQDGTNFWTGGTGAGLTGDGATQAFTYATDAVSFILAQDKYLALRITNHSSSSDTLRVGGSWSYVSAPTMEEAPPAAPTGLVAMAHVDSIRLSWNTNTEPDLHAYYIYRDTSSSASTLLDSVVAQSPPDTFYVDGDVVRDTTYYYRITAVDSAGNESDFSNEVSARLRLYGDVTDNGEVTAYDASWILQHTVGLRVLIGADSVVADVSGVEGITPYDASLVLRFVVGLITGFPVEGGGAPKMLFVQRTLWIGEMESSAEGALTVPVWIDEMEGVFSGRMTLSFDPEQVKVLGVKKGEVLGDDLFASHILEDRVWISFAGIGSLRGSGRMAEIVFEAVVPKGEAASGISLGKAQLNEGRIGVVISSSQVGRRPTSYRLFQNHPNPFNSFTTIQFDLAEGSEVNLSIYSLTGQRIRRLVEGKREAGRYGVVWDGRDERGREVSSGIYLCRMAVQAFGGGRFTEVRKMVLLR